MTTTTVDYGQAILKVHDGSVFLTGWGFCLYLFAIIIMFICACGISSDIRKAK